MGEPLMARRIVLIDIGEGLSLSGVLPSVALYGDYSARVVARGGVAPYSYEVIDGDELLDEAGLFLDASSGYFAGNAVVAGPIPITVRSTDTTGAYVERQFVIVVVAEPLSVVGHVPDGEVGVPQTFSYVVSGGVPPYVCSLHDEPDGWSVPDPSVPTIAITAQSTGPQMWRFRVTDSEGAIVELADSASFGWSPFALFADGEQGTWGVVEDLGYLFQDAAGTVPVSAVGQVVRRINDRSGNGLHLTGLGTLRELDGHRYIECDGSTSGFSFAGIGAGLQRHLTVALKLQNIATTQILFEEGPNYNGAPYGAFAIIVGGGKISLSQRVSSASLPSGYSQESFVSTTALDISSFEVDRTSNLLSDQMRGWSNGIEQHGTTDYSANGFGVPFVDATHYVGARAASSLRSTMSFYGTVYLNRTLSAAELGLLTDYFRSLTGLA